MQKKQLTPSSGSLSTKSSKTRCGILPDAELRYVRNFAGAEFGKKVNLTALLRTTKPLLNGEKRLFLVSFDAARYPGATLVLRRTALAEP